MSPVSSIMHYLDPKGSITPILNIRLLKFVNFLKVQFLSCPPFRCTTAITQGGLLPPGSLTKSRVANSSSYCLQYKDLIELIIPCECFVPKPQPYWTFLVRFRTGWSSSKFVILSGYFFSHPALPHAAETESSTSSWFNCCEGFGLNPTVVH